LQTEEEAKGKEPEGGLSGWMVILMQSLLSSLNVDTSGFVASD